LTPLLEVVDNVERALAAARQASDLDSLKKGMELIYQQLGGYLQKTGVEKIPAVGQPFDPNLHEAMLQVDSDQYADGIVVQELIPGYRINGRILRHSRVAVSRGKGKGAVESGESSSDGS
jgi:molecular chaperone GrpE